MVYDKLIGNERSRSSAVIALRPLPNLMRHNFHMGPPVARTSSLTFLAGGGEMGSRMRDMDWSLTPLGSAQSWPQSLRSTLSMLLPSKAQIILFWGPQFIVFYND